SLATVPLPDGSAASPRSPLDPDPLCDALLARFGIEVPIFPWPAPPRRVVRVSCQAYNARGDYEGLAAALVSLTREGQGGCKGRRPRGRRPADRAPGARPRL